SRRAELFTCESTLECFSIGPSCPIRELIIGVDCCTCCRLTRHVLADDLNLPASCVSLINPVVCRDDVGTYDCFIRKFSIRLSARHHLALMRRIGATSCMNERKAISVSAPDGPNK